MSQLSTWFALGTVGMVLGTLGLAVGYALVARENWRRYSILVAVPAIATVAYALMIFDVGTIESQTGDPIFTLRYLDWLLTTPLHVLYLGLLAGATVGAISKTMGLMGATIALGFFGAVLAPPARWALFLAGSLTFVGVIYYVFYDFDESARQNDETTLALFRKLRAFMIVLWLIYPVIWTLAPEGIGLMNVETSVLVVAYIDVVAKVGFGLIALSGNLALDEVQETTPSTAD